MAKELLSICIPTYNRSAHLVDLIPAIQNSVPPGKAALVKIYVSDNFSNDDTKQVMEKMTAQYPNIVYNRNATNIGMELNFLKLHELCQGEYFWLFGDDDEFVSKKSLGEVLDVLEQKSPGLLVLLQKKFSGCASRQFKNISEFVDFFSRKKPYVLIAHSLITCNIIKKNAFDIEFAKSKVGTFYCHMYGILKGAFESRTSVYLEAGKLIQPHKITGFREDNWPDLKKSWVQYYGYISDLFCKPELKKFAQDFFYPKGFNKLIKTLVLKTQYYFQKIISLIKN